MRTLSRPVLLFLVLAVLAVSPSPVHANCTQSIMPIFQCGFAGWFAPPPVASGTVTTVWWQLGYGNNLVNNGAVATPSNEGTGIAPVGVFSGNDSGLFGDWYGLTNADSVLPQYASQIPDGALCFNFEHSWAGGGVDGCADNPRTLQSADNDNVLNPYWGSAYGPCPQDDCNYETSHYLIDYPMAVLARESTNRFFALAFVASKTRHGDSSDISEGFFDLGEVTSGDPNPVTGKLNVIPWQQVPYLRGSPSFHPDPNFWNAHFWWSPVRLVHDGSTRPSTRVDSAGVGVLDQAADAGGLCRYQIEVASLVGPGSPGDPSSMSWSDVGDPIPCTAAPGDVQIQMVVPSDSALRLRTILGKTPRTTATTLANCRIGLCGDLGFEVVSRSMLLFGGPLVSEQAVDTVAERNRNAVRVSFRTTSELTVTGIDILGKGGAVVAGLPCRQCTSGLGDMYEALLTPGSLKGSRELRVRLNGPDTVSASFPID